MDSRALGANIKKFRKELNLTQEEAAAKCGLSTSYYRQLEQGFKLPKLETFIRISEVLHTPTDKLLSGNTTWTENIKTYSVIEKLEKLPEQERSEALRLLDYHIEILKKR
jgi:transcriptional regulator with XRE-family HTH domain